MKKVYKAHILFTKERTGFEVLENGYVAVEDGCVVGVSTSLSSLGCDEQTVTDFGAAYAERMYRRFIRDMWRFGTMRSCVFATIHTASTRLLMNLFREAGMGAMVGKVAMNRNCPPELIESVEDMVAGNEALIAEFPQYSPLTSNLSPLVRPIITPRFVPSCTSEMLQACGDLAAKYQLPVQSHLSENMVEIQWVHTLERESTSYGDAYNRYGLFG